MSQKINIVLILGIIICSCNPKKGQQKAFLDNPFFQLTKNPKIPEHNRFQRQIITKGLDEPMELTVVPDGKVVFVTRHGTISQYDPQKNSKDTLLSLNVKTREGNGLMGITHDPNFQKNGFIYLFYTPDRDDHHHRISRFTIKDNQLYRKSENILLKIPVEIEDSGGNTHQGGSIEFDNKGNLFIATGDNTIPFESDGYAPLDKREGRRTLDAQRTAANPDDLRGKILRINPQKDGTYTIPKGNLFPKDGSRGKPEIFIMGCRNPFQITYDRPSGYLYWGEVGPDANKAGPRGPKGYDEINRAKKAGNYGWPYFIGNNKPYADYNFANGEIGDTFNVDKPINNSINNTGPKVLPPAQKAFIWYPYGQSEEFPAMETGGRTAEAGQV